MTKVEINNACNVIYFSYFCTAKQSHLQNIHCGKSRFNSKSETKVSKVVIDLAPLIY